MKKLRLDCCAAMVCLALALGCSPSLEESILYDDEAAFEKALQGNPSSSVLAEALHTALGTGNAEFAKRLIDSGANVDWKTDLGTPLLSILAHEGNCQMVELLLEEGADPNAADTFAQTPLHILLFEYRGSDEDRTILGLLLEHGADPSLRTRNKLERDAFEIVEHRELQEILPLLEAARTRTDSDEGGS
ncbi:MAG: hypothetical protein GY851_01435 [bacterium]|nr:hypothetical protein [bacterium]